MRSAFYLALLVLLAACASKPSSPKQKVAGKELSIQYGAPSKRDREIFGALVPYGEIWRTGANEATVLLLAKDATVNGRSLPAGKYSLWTIPSETTWQVIFNRQTGQWGTEHDPAQDLLTVEIPTSQSSEVVEQMVFRIDPAEGGEDLLLAWDVVRMTVPFRFGPSGTPATDSTAQSPSTP